MAGARATEGETLETLPAGVFLAGRISGERAMDAQVEEGGLAGARAAAFCGLGPTPDAGATPPADQEYHPPVRPGAPGQGKRFVCFCEDVTDQDLETAIAEGYESSELLKRYSTVSMGPCQGKMCAANAIRFAAHTRGQTGSEMGKTTSRPPVVPVKLGALAGQSMEPVQVTPIHEWHQERGARMMVAGLWLRPEHYGDPIAEVRAVRERVGLIDVSTLGKLQFTGPGAPNLLEGLYANTWRGLRQGRVRYGVMCNDEGVVLDDGVGAHLGDEEWYMTTTSSGATSVFEWIQWWVQSGWGEGVHVLDLTEAFAAFNLSGPEARAVLQKLTGCDLSNRAFPHLRVRTAEVAGAPCRLLRLGFTGELSFEIHCPSASALGVWEALMAAGEEFAMVPFGMEAQRVLRLEKGHLIVGQDTDATSDALAAGLDWAVKLDKGDFLGQRELVRVAAADPGPRLVGFKMVRPDLVPEEGEQIVAPGADQKLEIVGWVTSSRFSPTLQEAIGLCWLPAAMAAEEGTVFTIHLDGNLEEARVHHGAFYDPRGERLKM